MAYAGTVQGMFSSVQLHMSGRYNKLRDVISRNGTKIRMVHNFSLHRTAQLSAGGA